MTTATDPIRAGLRTFSNQYDYDTSYMERLLDLAPAAYDKFAAAMGMSQAADALPAEAAAIAKVATLLGANRRPRSMIRDRRPVMTLSRPEMPVSRNTGASASWMARATSLLGSGADIIAARVYRDDRARDATERGMQWPPHRDDRTPPTPRNQPATRRRVADGTGSSRRSTLDPAAGRR